MTTIDAATRMAYVDGELDALARRRVEQAMAEDPALAEAVARDRALRETLKARFDRYAEAEVPDRFRALLESKVVPLAEAPRRPRVAWNARRWMQGAAIAATLVLGLVIGRQVGDVGSVATNDGVLVARGRLASTLDTQLASTQPNDPPFRIGLTFRARDGGICRTFSRERLQGIACRDGDRWNVVRTAMGEQSGAYRQASSGALIEDAQTMMAGAPFSATEEAAAKARHWR
ncbi:MAG TPA: anti-sigma factor [Sphingomonas sp.]|nr:anti-sigma factor [Sphingomonas sp.]